MKEKQSEIISKILARFYNNVEKIGDPDEKIEVVKGFYSYMVEAFARKLENEEPGFEWNIFYDSCFKTKQ